MIEKLELKYLCGYLPYGLEILHGDFVAELQWLLRYGCVFDYLIDRSRSRAEYEKIKPLLLPLSALTEPMEDGIVPTKEIEKMVGYKMYVSQNFDGELLLKAKNECYLFTSDAHAILEYLCSKHFDIYGLIPAGLAIDKRTIK